MKKTVRVPRLHLVNMADPEAAVSDVVLNILLAMHLRLLLPERPPAASGPPVGSDPDGAESFGPDHLFDPDPAPATEDADDAAIAEG